MASKALFRSITVVSSPYHVGILGIAVANGPMYLKSRGIVNKIKEQGVSVKEITVPSAEKGYDGEIGRSFELFRRISTIVRDEHARNALPIVLAGNCSSAVGVAAGLSDAVRRAGGELGCVWFDAHDDFNTPDTMMSGYFDSMPIAMLGNLCFRSLLKTVPGYTPMNLQRLIHVGMRDVNDLERAHVEEHSLSVVWGDENTRVDFAKGLASFLEKTPDSQPTMVHFDVDSMDISIGKANKFACPGGLFREDVTECFRRIVASTAPLSLTVASFDPSFEGAEGIADAAIEGVATFVEALKSKGVLVGE